MTTLSDMSGDRRETIAGVISAELDRQAHEGAHRIDVPRLAEAIEAAIEPEGGLESETGVPEEGPRPDQLNATNDD